jgi:hypothetical protein
MPAPAPATGSPREVTGVERPARGYPSARDAVATNTAVMRGAVGLAIALGLTLGASGCATPTCVPTAREELKLHGQSAVSAFGVLELKGGLEQLGIGLGLVTHPTPSAGMMPGGMIMPVPIVPPP